MTNKTLGRTRRITDAPRISIRCDISIARNNYCQCSRTRDTWHRLEVYRIDLENVFLLRVPWKKATTLFFTVCYCPPWSARSNVDNSFRWLGECRRAVHAQCRGSRSRKKVIQVTRSFRPCICVFVRWSRVTHGVFLFAMERETSYRESDLDRVAVFKGMTI